MDRFDEMQCFIRVVESKGITAAAERMGVAKSVVSRRLQELENRLGVKLLQRTTRRIHLTDDGRRFYEQSRRIFEQLEEAEQSISSGQQHVHGLLRVAAPLSLTLRHLTPVFNAFLEQYPDVDLDLDVQDREINLIEEGVDLTIRVGQLHDSSLVARKLAPVPSVLCASPDYLERYGVPERPEQLAKHHGLSYGHISDQRQWTLFDAEGGAHYARPHIRMRINNGDVILQSVLAGFGVAVMPTFICYQELAQGLLQPILTDYTIETTSAYAIYPSRRHLPLRVRVFIDFLAEQMGESPPWMPTESSG